MGGRSPVRGVRFLSWKTSVACWLIVRRSRGIGALRSTDMAMVLVRSLVVPGGSRGSTVVGMIASNEVKKKKKNGTAR